MKKLFLFFVFICILSTYTSATEYTPPEVPQSAEKYMPEASESFSEGLWHIAKEAIKELQPNLAEGARVCFSTLACVLITSVLKSFSGTSQKISDLVSVLTISTLLVSSTDSMIRLGAETVQEMSEYGKLLLPVLTGALASQGGTTTSAALYAGTSFFNVILSSATERLLVPMLYVYMVLCIAHRAIGENILKSLCDFLKWLVTWGIKLVIYLFTGYLGITGVVSGTTDAAALKAAKITISGAVPVVGNIISDASETVLVSAGVVKGSVGSYGLLVIAAIWIVPFIKIGLQYLLLKVTYATCSMFGTKGSTEILNDFSGIMGLLVAMTGTVCLLLLVSIVCYLKGVG